MRNVLLILSVCAAIVFSSCTSAPEKMYYWEMYSYYTYDYIKSGDELNDEDILQTYEIVMDGQEDTIRQTIPPGVCADYGYLLVRKGIRMEEAGDEAEGAELIQEGKSFLIKEKELYPESEKFIDGVLKKLEL